jgi:FtsZ-binding cell division protein ZapB
MPTPTTGTPAAAEPSFTTIDDAIGSFREDDEQDQGQGGLERDDYVPQDSERESGQDHQPDDSQGEDPGDGAELEAGTEEIGTEEEQDEDSAQGQFIPLDGKVKGPDGQVTTVKELLARQSEFAEVHHEKQRLNEERQQFGSARDQVRQAYETVQQQQRRLAQIAQAILPRRPDPSLAHSDPQSFTVLNDIYNRTVEMMQGLDADYQQAEAYTSQEQSQALENFRSQQAQELVRRDPNFGKDDYYKTFWNEMNHYGGRVYGYTAKELSEGMNDHRQYLVMRDAIAFQKLKAQQKRQQGRAQGQRQGPVNGNGRTPLAASGRPVQADAQRRKVAWDKFNKSRRTINDALDLID